MASPNSSFPEDAPLSTVSAVIRRQAAERPEATALVFEGRRTSYAGLDARTDLIAGALIASGVEPAMRVAYLGKNSDSYFELLVGAAKARAILVPLNWRLADPEIAFAIEDAKPTILFVGREYEDRGAGFAAASSAPKIVAVEGDGGSHEGLEAWLASAGDAKGTRRPEPGDVLLIMYTSGTTGRPKGAMLSHRSLLRIDGDRPAPDPEWFTWSAGEKALIAMPTFHIGGTGQGLRALKGGSTAVILREFAVDEVLAQVAEHRITKLFLVPSAIQAVLRHPSLATADYSCLEYILYGASPVQPDLLRQAMDVFGCGFVQMYGMTETSGTVAALSPEDHASGSKYLTASAGRPLAGVEIRIVDDEGKDLPAGSIGEIAIRSPANMVGYWGRPDATAQTIDGEGWLRSGDVGTLGRDGYLFVRDRVKDVIISGGENIYPAEVEGALSSHPAVAEVAVIGIPDDRWGEAGKAVVVLREGRTASSGELIEWAKSRIASYKAPKSIDFIASLPRNASGKILRRDLRDRYWKDHERKVG